jgi:type I restriction enzyme, S subunit
MIVPNSLPKNWYKIPIKRFLTISSGDMISADEELTEGVPIYGGNGVRGFTYKTNTKGPALVIGRVGAKCGNVHLVESDFWASEHAFVVYPRQEFDLRYGKYLLIALDLNQYEIRTAQPLLNTEAVVTQTSSWPSSIKSQQIIADYLDREIAHIDVLVAEKEKMLALLEEKRAALISRNVTRGLNPDVPLKPSGLDWLGEIPEHWQIERAKNLFIVRDQRSERGEEELLTVSHITGVTPRSEKDVYMFQADDKAGYKLCYPNDLVVNTLWGWMGAMGVTAYVGIVSPDYHVYTTKGQLLPEFVDLLCRSKPFVAEVNRWSKGVWSSRLRLYPENFFEMRLPVPPREEQIEIVKAIETSQRKTRLLIEALQKSTSLAKERRAALITAAVTGRIPIEAMRS